MTGTLLRRTQTSRFCRPMQSSKVQNLPKEGRCRRRRWSQKLGKEGCVAKWTTHPRSRLMKTSIEIMQMFTTWSKRSNIRRTTVQVMIRKKGRRNLLLRKWSQWRRKRRLRKVFLEDLEIRSVLVFSRLQRWTKTHFKRKCDLSFHSYFS